MPIEAFSVWLSGTAWVECGYGLSERNRSKPHHTSSNYKPVDLQVGLNCWQCCCNQYCSGRRWSMMCSWLVVLLAHAAVQCTGTCTCMVQQWVNVIVSEAWLNQQFTMTMDPVYDLLRLCRSEEGSSGTATMLNRPHHSERKQTLEIARICPLLPLPSLCRQWQCAWVVHKCIWKSTKTEREQFLKVNQ